jgi:hypothetical protein
MKNHAIFINWLLRRSQQRSYQPTASAVGNAPREAVYNRNVMRDVNTTRREYRATKKIIHPGPTRAMWVPSHDIHQKRRNNT